MKEEGLAVSSKLGIPVTKKDVNEADGIIVLLDKSPSRDMLKYQKFRNTMGVIW